MERPLNVLGVMTDASAVVDDDIKEGGAQSAADASWPSLGRRSPLTKARSLSDGGGTPSKLIASPHIAEAARRASKDDSNLRDLVAPVTPRRSDLNHRGLSIHMPPARDLPRDFTPSPAASGAYVKPTPLSPKLDQSQIYASPTNILSRRSRGLDFSRAATSLHHSTLAEQSSPDSSPTIGGARAAMNIPSRRGAYGGLEQTSTSLWSMMGSHEKMNLSGSLGSTHAIGSDLSSSSDGDEIMDDDTDEAFVTTPQLSKTSMLSGQPPVGAPFGSPAMSSLMSFQQRQRPRRHPKKKLRGPLGLGFNSAGGSMTNSPSNAGTTARRESISWQANQLHISSADSEDGAKATGEADGSSGDGQRNVVRRFVHRRANLLPKTKTFARIRAALAEETAPAETDLRHEAEVVKQVRESDLVQETRAQSGSGEPPVAATTLSSPNMPNQDSLYDFGEEDMIGDLAAGLSSSFKQHAMKNSKGKSFWDTFSESSSIGGTRTTPPPPAFQPRGSSSGISEDVSMDSPSLANPPGFPSWMPSHSRANSFRSDTPHPLQNTGPPPPSVADITRRINSKRRRDDDLDPVGFYKRRAVSPGVSTNNSPVLQSPRQRDSMPWGSRPGSNAGEKAGSASAPSDSGSMSGTPGNLSSGSGGRVNSKPRVGFQGMVDTNDGIMRMSIE